MGSHLSGLHFNKKYLRAVSYRYIMENELELHLENVPFQTRWMGIQHSRVPPHFGSGVMGYLNANYRGKWIGWSRPVAWAAGSPDLTSLDLFMGLH